MKKNLLFFVVSILAFSGKAQDITGKWQGGLSVQGTEIPLILNISKTQNGLDASLDSPAQGAFGLEARSVTFEDDVLKVDLPNQGIAYEGTLTEEQVFEGYFKQGGVSIPLNLSRDESKATKITRPQDPKEPFPYHSEEVVFRNKKDSIDLAGTISLPESTGKFPAVILISGSGAQNRDSEVLGHKPFLVLADHLTRNGVAVLRFDDRGVAGSGGDFSSATTNDFATDAQAALDFLKSRNEIDTDNLGLIGHSEGGIVASLIASENPEVDFMVLMAAPGMRGDRFMLLQREALNRKMGATEKQITADQDLFTGIYDLILKSDKTGPGLKAQLNEYLSNLPETPLDENTRKQLVEELARPWWVNLLKQDASVVLEKVDIPVLAINGKNDVQVVHEENLAGIREALERGGNRNVEIKAFENLNHLFQESRTGLPDEYGRIEQTFSPIARDYLTAWILDQVR